MDMKRVNGVLWDAAGGKLYSIRLSTIKSHTFGDLDCAECGK